jgi:peptide/nickel transport system substrate-binding protein
MPEIQIPRNYPRLFVLLFMIALVLSACSGPADIDLPLTVQSSPVVSPTVPIPTPTPEPPPPPTLVICLRDEPSSLYLYAPSNPEAISVLSAIYDGPIDVRGFEAQPVILEKVPSFADGDAWIETVQVGEGDIFFNPRTRDIDWLESSMRYLPTECHNMDCSRYYWEGEVWMERMVVEFRLRNDIRWSDGTPLTAADSAFSFQLDADGATPSTKFLVDRTTSYEAIDAQTVRWTGIPGYFDPEFQTLFWSPLPQHVLGAYGPSELFSLDSAARTPMGWGAYEIESWVDGEQIVLHRNTEYFRASEGLPAFEYLIYRFIGDSPPEASLQQILTYECDVVDESLVTLDLIPELTDLEQTGRLSVAWAPGFLLERMEFNLAPVSRSMEPISSLSYTRRALATCIDRQRILDEVLFGMGQISQTYLPASHPLYMPPEDPLAYDPAAGNAELARLGWVDTDESVETPRVSRGVLDVEYGTPLSLSLRYTAGAFQEAAALRIKEDLLQCGAHVELFPMEPAELFAPWPDGEVFGRTFELLAWAWPTVISPTCEMYDSGEVPYGENPYGINAAAFRNDDYDHACRRILLGPPDGQDFVDAVVSTQQLYASYLPSVPLYARPRIIAFNPEICGIEIDASAFSSLWNVEEYAPIEFCTD